jgi:hypothetical protein
LTTILHTGPNPVAIIVNSPVDKFIAFCTHFSFICMIACVNNVGVRSTSIAYFQ